MTTVAVAPRSSRRLLMVLIAAPLLMLAFVFGVLVPLYGILCNLTGSQMKPNNNGIVLAEVGTGQGRMIEVFFEPRVLDGLPVAFTVDHPHQRIEVGVRTFNTFRLKNLADHAVDLRPIHLVSPQHAALTFHMPVCFCFTDQTVEAGGEREFPVVYGFGEGTDSRVKDVTIGYTLLAIRAGESLQASEERVREATDGRGTIVSPPREVQP